MKQNNFSIVSLGCARSLVDSEGMVNDLTSVGFDLVPEGTREAVTVLNTCSFIQAAIDETEENIELLLGRKERGEIKHLAVVGCYPSRYKREALLEKYPGVDVWLSTSESAQLKSKLSELVFQRKFVPKSVQGITGGSPIGVGDDGSTTNEADHMGSIDRAPLNKDGYRTKLTPNHFAYLKISEGCNNWCTFCTIPKIRGVHTSKPLERVIEEAKLQIALGAQELVLIAEDTTCWGEDIYGKPSLPLLLNELAKLPVKWIRNMYIYPSRVDGDFIAAIKNNDNIINYLDMPVQHVSTKMLDSMRRKHDKDFLMGILREFRQEIPDLALRTTFICGFPGETEDDVREIKEVMEQVHFDQLGCFTYSEERETKAARMADKVDIEVARQRVDELMELQYQLVGNKNVARIGQEYDVVLEGTKLARSYREAPEVDSKIVIEGAWNDAWMDTFKRVKITGASGYDLVGEII
ncbi:MAG: 30S ribosomal protein S12 methylthiotransferase RimO [bacterium]|nr:30S ribosomal protein S12 methylthiotransferase RimO [bacterium]